MCVVPSWIETKDAVLFLTDKDALEHKIDWKDATGHSAIRKVWPGIEGKKGEGLGPHTPKVVMDAILAGKLNRMAAAGDVTVTGEWIGLPFPKIGGSLDLRSLTSLPEKVAFPAKIGGYLYLGSLTSLPEKVAFPKECGYLDLGSLKDRSRVPVYKNGILQK